VRAQDYVRDGGQDVLRAELAGCDPERDIEVTASCGVLTIRAERREDARGRHYPKFRYGTFVRTFRLPPGAGESRLRPVYGNVILQVTANLVIAPGHPERRCVPVMADHYIDPA